MKLEQFVIGKYLQSTIWPVLQRIDETKVYQVIIKERDNRSLNQNALSHAWYGQIAVELDITPLDAKCLSKLLCGVPILRAEEDDFRQDYDALVKHRFSYEEKLRLMKQFPVTSLMSKSQLNQYLEAMKEHWAESGVQLMYPDEVPVTEYGER